MSLLVQLHQLEPQELRLLLVPQVLLLRQLEQPELLLLQELLLVLFQLEQLQELQRLLVSSTESNR